jgi:hypothetical protein
MSFRRVFLQDVETGSAATCHKDDMQLGPRDDWESTSRLVGMKDTARRILMLDGFNNDWIEFVASHDGSRKAKHR